MQMHIIRHLEELACPAGITPQGFRNRHCPSTMFRTAKVSRLNFNCPTKACCLCFVLLAGFQTNFCFLGLFEWSTTHTATARPRKYCAQRLEAQSYAYELQVFVQMALYDRFLQSLQVTIPIGWIWFQATDRTWNCTWATGEQKFHCQTAKSRTEQ